MAVVRIPIAERIVNYLRTRRGPALMQDLIVLGTAAEVGGAVQELIKSGQVEEVRITGLRLKDDRYLNDPELHDELKRRRNGR